MVYSTNGFVLRLALCYFVLVYFSVRLALRLRRLGERATLNAFLYVCSICTCLVLSVSSSSWCFGRVVACDCDTPWTFSYPFLRRSFQIEKKTTKLSLVTNNT